MKRMDRIYVMELVRAFQCGQISRRDFLRRATAALGSASAAAMLLAACRQPTAGTPPPVVVTPSPTATSPATVEPTPTPAATEAPAPTETAATTPAAGVAARTVEYPDPDGETLMGYLALPATDEPRPAVAVIQEWWGVDDHIKDVTRRFAQEGFVALAPDLYHGVVVSEPDEARKLVMELDMDEAVREIQHAIAFLLQQESVAGPRVGIVGFCMGGRLALRTALIEPNLGAVVAFYGTPLAPEEVSQVKAPILGLYGAEDTSIPVEQVRAMEAALQQAGIEHEIEVYDGAGHAFFNDARESYRPEAAADAWQRTLAWLREYLHG